MLTLQRVLIFLSALLFTVSAQAQIGIGTASPDSTAILDVSSTTKGFLAPRMNTTQMNAIATPAIGLAVYNTDSSIYCIYTGSAWRKMITSSNLESSGALHFVGNSYLGKNSGSGATGTSEGSSANQANIYLGDSSGYATTTGTTNLGIGNNTLHQLDTRQDMVAIGNKALYDGNNSPNDINGTMAVGSEALYGGTYMGPSTALGYQSQRNLTTGGNNTTVGYKTMNTATTGFSNVAIGHQSMSEGTNPSVSVAVGYEAAKNLTASLTTAVGYRALTNATTGTSNTAVGSQSGVTITTGARNTFAGAGADATAADLTKAVAIGYNAKVAASNSMALGGTGADAVNVGINTTTPTERLYVAGNIKSTDTVKTTALQVTSGATSGYVLQSDTTGNASWADPASTGAVRFVGNSYLGLNSGKGATGTSEGTSTNQANIYLGDSSGFNTTSGGDNVGVGNNALHKLNTYHYLVAIGNNAYYKSDNNGYANSGSIAIGGDALFYGTYYGPSTAIGYQSQYGADGATQAFNTSLGYRTLYMNVSGSTNVAIGHESMSTGDPSNSVAIGYQAAKNLNNSDCVAIGNSALLNDVFGKDNTAVGYHAGLTLTDGMRNTFLGFGADASSATLIRSAAIGYNAKVATSSSMVLGGTGGDAINVGINTTSPTERLYVVGDIQSTDTVKTSKFQMSNGAASGYLLKSDATGNASWANTISMDTVKTSKFQMSNGAVNGYFLKTDASGNASWANNASAVLYTGTSYLGVHSGRGATGSSEGTATNQGNILLGDSCGVATTTATGNVGIGNNVLHSMTARQNVVAIGNNAYYNDIAGPTSSNGSVAIGAEALFNGTSIGPSTAVGYQSQYSSSSGGFNTSLGYQALYGNTSGNNNVAVGDGAMSVGDAVQSSVAIGYHAARNLNAASTVAIGVTALANASTGTQNTGIGRQSGMTITTGSKNTFIGYAADASASNTSSSVAIGANASVACSNCMVLGGTSTDAVNVGINTTTPTERLYVVGDIQSTDTIKTSKFQMSNGATNGYILKTDASGNASWTNTISIDTVKTSKFQMSNGATNGYILKTDASGNASWTNTVSIDTVKTSKFQLSNGATNGYFLKTDASGNASWANNISAMLYTGTSYLGVHSGRGASGTTEGTSTNLGNIYMGDSSGYAATSGTNNIGIGYQTLYKVTSGIGNTCLGYRAGNAITTGVDNTLIGYNANSSSGTHNATAIGYNALVTSDNSIVLGGTGGDGVNVGIGVTNPSAQLQICNTVTGPTVLALQNSTGITWQIASTSASRLTFARQFGNTTFSMEDGRVGIAVSAPKSTLDVSGTLGLKVQTGNVAGFDNPDGGAGIFIYSSGTGTITLPTVGDVTNRMYVIINQTGGDRTISAYNTLQGSATTTIPVSSALWIVSDGTHWQQIK